MAESAANTENSGPKLSELFDSVWKAYEFLEESTDPSNSTSMQIKVQKAIEEAEKAVHMVNDLNLFSTNEQLEEITTNEIKYLLLPGLLGYLMNKSLKESRFDTVKKSQIYFIDFLRLCKLYGITDVALPKLYSPSEEGDESEAPQPQKMFSDHLSIDEQQKRRLIKIERFKKQKEIEQNLRDLYSLVKQENVDEDSKRNYYITLVKKWITDALEACESIEAEIPLLEHMAKMKSGKLPDRPLEEAVKDKKKGVFRPFIITKDMMQKQVFGLGYPGVPTYTVDEFYQQRVDEGVFPAAGSAPQKQDARNEEREKEKEAKKKKVPTATLR